MIYLFVYLVSSFQPQSWRDHNLYSMRLTNYVVKSSAVILQIHVPSPIPIQYNVERSKELCLDGFNTVRGGWEEGVGTCSLSSEYPSMLFWGPFDAFPCVPCAFPLLICTRVESMTSPIVLTWRKSAFLHTN